MDSYKKTSVLDDTNPANRDPLTQEPGSHPVGTGIGSASGAAAGAAIGAAVGGPVGAVVGGVVGAVSGGAAGHAAGEAANPTVEDSYWRENYKARPYYRAGRTYEDYRPAFKYGWESASRSEYRGRKFTEVENELKDGWTSNDASSTWAENREAVRDAWSRVDGV